MLLWGGWLLVTAGVFSYMSGIFHEYYTVALAPPIAALVGIVVPELWRTRQDKRSRGLLVAMTAVTGIWAYALLDRTPDWTPWLRYLVLIATAVGCAALLLGPWLAARRLAASAGWCRRGSGRRTGRVVRRPRGVRRRHRGHPAQRADRAGGAAGGRRGGAARRPVRCCARWPGRCDRAVGDAGRDVRRDPGGASGGFPAMPPGSSSSSAAGCPCRQGCPGRRARPPPDPECRRWLRGRQRLCAPGPQRASQRVQWPQRSAGAGPATRPPTPRSLRSSGRTAATPGRPRRFRRTRRRRSSWRRDVRSWRSAGSPARTRRLRWPSSSSTCARARSITSWRVVAPAARQAARAFRVAPRPVRPKARAAAFRWTRRRRQLHRQPDQCVGGRQLHREDRRWRDGLRPDPANGAAGS